MTPNVGGLDRILRFAAGLALMVFACYGTTGWRWIGIAGPVLILTALVRVCPAYWLLRVRTTTPMRKAA